MRLLGFLFVWLRRLPFRFTGLFILFNFIYLVLVSRLVEAGGVQTIGGLLWSVIGLPNLPELFGFYTTIRVFVEGLVIVLLIAGGVILSYNLAALFYRHLRATPRAMRFEDDTNPNWIKMTLVSPQGERTQTDEF